jgi:hypothetical protein
MMVNLSASFLYYILDNIVWAVSIGIVNKSVHNINLKWKSTKDICSMIRRLTNVIYSVTKTRR